MTISEMFLVDFQKGRGAGGGERHILGFLYPLALHWVRQTRDEVLRGAAVPWAGRCEGRGAASR